VNIERLKSSRFCEFMRNIFVKMIDFCMCKRVKDEVLFTFNEDMETIKKAQNLDIEIEELLQIIDLKNSEIGRLKAQNKRLKRENEVSYLAITLLKRVAISEENDNTNMCKSESCDIKKDVRIKGNILQKVEGVDNGK